MATYKRRIKIIRPKLQMKLTLTFVGLTLLALMLQFMVFLRTMTTIAVSLPADHDVLMDAMPEVLLQSLLLTFCVVVPLVFVVGVLLTFRIAGPVYRFETYIKQILRGENPGECRLREGDELGELCGLINQVTLPLREKLEQQKPQPSAATERQAA
jgi:signal transduction histidine kinase